MRLAGSARPEAISAERTRSRDSATALSARPTIMKATLPGADLHLHVDRARVDALEGDGGDARDHAGGAPLRPA